MVRNALSVILKWSVIGKYSIYHRANSIDLDQDYKAYLDEG